MNEQYLDPALLGRYPPALKRDIFGEAWPDWPAADMQAIKQPLDFVGINYYTRGVTKARRQRLAGCGAPVRQPRATYTETGWEVLPHGLTDTLVWFKQRYGDLPLYVTENGAAFFDPPTVDDAGARRPAARRYYRDHMRAVHDAIAAGVDVRGYFAWSLLDNLEWSLGYSKRFGIVHVNFETQATHAQGAARSSTPTSLPATAQRSAPADAA